MPYSEEFKNTVLSRVMSGELSVIQACKTYGVSHGSIAAWRKKVREAATSGDSGTSTPHKGEAETMSKLKLPKGTSYLAAYKAVVARQLLDDTNFGAYCRKAGLLAADVDGWTRWFQNHPEGCNIDDLKSERQLRLQAQNEAAEANRNLAIKEKALAETATMLVLAKKAQALWGVKAN